MGQRGPAPKPTALRVFEGITKPSQMPKFEPKPKLASETDCPKVLTEKQKIWWDSLAPELIRIGTLSLTDIPAFMRYIDLCIEYEEMTKQIAEKNYILIIRNEDGTPKYATAMPQVNIKNQALSLLLKLEQQFGLTPASRTRIMTILGGGKGEEIDPFA